MPQIPLISFDEAGFTGPNLLHEDQPLFSYAAVDLSVDEAAVLISEIRDGRRKKIQAKELKASVLKKRRDWPEIVELLLRRLNGRFCFIVFDKRLAFAGKVFEYLIEPVVEERSIVFYRHQLHRVVTGALHRSIQDADGPAEAIATQFESFMRSFDPLDAPAIFTGAADAPQDVSVLAELLRFSKGYAGVISERSKHLRDDPALGTWVLDLTSTALMSLLMQHFGLKYPKVNVLCDDSKPLQEMKHEFDKYVGCEQVFPVSDGRRLIDTRLHLASPMEFGSSLANPTLQIADLIAGLSVQVYGPNPPSELLNYKPILERHLHANHILPQTAGNSQLPYEVKQANLFVLRTLASRAALHQDPLKGIDQLYEKAFKRATSIRSRLRRRA